ncbi:nitric oxide reductase activation protein NorD [Marinobacterium arenosum]|uniref:nitric oxide reductase activation protein NorD n=1 Tax=Marinobacterium arenosum TaxID=2862496 RepID=UPI001C983466|nr:VWA domain-containing protein [Marinobacterium arenosum]MBY4676467.1 VWA domain-containing protein [Marinobacterium arenosum]
MEEFVGALWHRLVTRQSATDYPDAAVALADLQPQLAPFFRALGGSPGLLLEGAEPRAFRAPRRFIQRVAGSHSRFTVGWQDERSLRLPPMIAQFDDPALNEALYFWLAALASQLPTIRHWLVDNQRVTAELLARRPGLAAGYRRLVEATLAQRQQLLQLEGAALEREQAIRQALLEPGSVSRLPKAAGDPLPVPLWLYPAPLRDVSIAAEDEQDEVTNQSAAQPEKLELARKQARRTDDRKETDGLMIFQLEALFTRVEQVDVDRVQEEDLDDEGAPDDLDIISLSRQRRAGAGKLKFDLDLPAPQQDELALGDGIRLPEWDYRTQQLRPDYCLLQPMLADDAEPAPLPEHLRGPARLLKNRFANLKPQRSWQRRQPQGEELDLDIWLDSLTQPGRSTEPVACFRQRQAAARDLSCLLLADISMSTDAGLNAEQRVIDVIRDSLGLFAEALSGSGDRFAIYGFSSIKNKQVRYHLLKNFNEPYGDRVRGRIQAIKPGFYTRMGAAIRQSTAILEQQKTEQKLLLIISDGKPNDIDHYEGRYGIEDTRQAIQQARAKGLQPFCVTIDEQASDYLPYLFGDRGYALVNDLTRLPMLLPKLYLNLTGAH